MPSVPHCYVVDKDGWTALMIPIQEGHRECLSILLAHGAEANKAMQVRFLSAMHVPCTVTGLRAQCWGG